MRKVRTKKLPDNCVVLTPHDYTRLMALVRESGREPGELLSIAIAVFDTATRHLNIMHPIPRKPFKKPREKSTSATPIGASVQEAIRKLTKGSQT